MSSSFYEHLSKFKKVTQRSMSNLSKLLTWTIQSGQFVNFYCTNKVSGWTDGWRQPKVRLNIVLILPWKIVAGMCGTYIFCFMTPVLLKGIIKCDTNLIQNTCMLVMAHNQFMYDGTCMYQCYSWGGTMGHRPIQLKNGPLTTEIAILNLERMTHWNFKFIGNNWKMAHTMVCPAITLMFAWNCIFWSGT